MPSPYSHFNSINSMISAFRIRADTRTPRSSASAINSFLVMPISSTSATCTPSLSSTSLTASLQKDLPLPDLRLLCIQDSRLLRVQLKAGLLRYHSYHSPFINERSSIKYMTINFGNHLKMRCPPRVDIFRMIVQTTIRYVHCI